MFEAPLIVARATHFARAINRSCAIFLGQGLSSKYMTIICYTQNMHTRPTLPELTFISFSLILYMLSLQGVVISYLYILYLIYQSQALSYLPNPCRHPVCHISCSYSTDSVTHHSDSKWSNWIFYGMLAVYRYVEAKCYTFLFNCFNCQNQ